MMNLIIAAALLFMALLIAFFVGFCIGIHDGKIIGVWMCKMRIVNQNRKNNGDLWEHTWLMRRLGGEW